MDRDKISQINDLPFATPKDLQSYLMISAINLIENSKKKPTLEEEIRLAYTNPAYESLVNKAKRARDFFLRLSLEIDKEMYLHLLFITENENKLNALINKIEAEEKYIDEINHLLATQYIIFKKIHDEIVNERRLFLESLENKIKMLDNLIFSLNEQLTRIENEIKAIKYAIIETETSLRNEINKMIDASIPQHTFELHLTSANNIYDANEVKSIHINREIIIAAIKTEADYLLVNPAINMEIDSSKFIDNFLYGIYNDYYITHIIPENKRHSLIQSSLNNESIFDFKITIKSHIDSFNEKISNTQLQEYFISLHEKREVLDSKIEERSLLRQNIKQTEEYRKNIIETRERFIQTELINDEQINREQIRPIINQGLYEINESISINKNPIQITLSSDDLLKNLLAQFDAPAQSPQTAPLTEADAPKKAPAQSADELLNALLAQTEPEPSKQEAENDNPPDQPPIRVAKRPTGDLAQNGLGLFSHRRSPSRAQQRRAVNDNIMKGDDLPPDENKNKFSEQNVKKNKKDNDIPPKPQH